jgi:hypothetical protein
VPSTRPISTSREETARCSRSAQGARGQARHAPADDGDCCAAAANLSADPENEYFSDGMTEEIINALQGAGHARRLTILVLAFKGKKDVDVRQIGAKLNVTTLLEGSVQGRQLHPYRGAARQRRERLSALVGNLRPTARGHLRTSGRDFTVDRRCAEVASGRHRSRRRADEEPRRLHDLSEGRFHFNKYTEVGLRKALELFQSALLQDPGCTRPRRYCRCLRTRRCSVAPEDAYPRAKSAAERALRREGGAFA